MIERRALRAARACFAGLALLGLGLWTGGATGRVHALVRATTSSPRLSPIEGSKCAAPREAVLDGQRARLRRCVAPRGMSLGQVREHFEEIARRECRLSDGPDRDLPYVAVDQGDRCFVLWASLEEGRRKGVIATRSADRIEYLLLDSDLVAEGSGAGSVLLPGGAQAPEGARAGLTVEEGGSSFTFLEMPGAPREAANALGASLTRAGFSLDEESASELAETSAKRRAGRVVLPFKGKDRKGLVVVAPSGMGSSRATVVVR